MYITSIKIENLRCFEQAELTFQYPGRETETPLRFPNINLLLGDNGAGKTTVLKAIALATLSPLILNSGFVPYRLVRRTEIGKREIKEARANAEILLHPQDLTGTKISGQKPKFAGMIVLRRGDHEIFGEHYDSTLQDIRSQMYEDNSSAVLLVGYGASRRVEDSDKIDLTARRKARLLRYERVAGLFENHISLMPLASWLPSFRKENPGHHKQVVNLINRLLPEGASFAGEFEQGEYLFEINGTKAPFGALSDGYRAYIGWIADLLYHICMGAPKGAKLVENRGIVLVDEIDLHLHPEWQRSVIKTISETLPNLQFVFTSHSPIVAGSLQKENIFVMETTADGASVVKQYDEEIYGLNAEQVLLSPYFNLPTTRAASFAGELKQLSLKAGRGDLDAALAFMERLAAPKAAPKSSANAVAARKKANSKKKPSSKK
ncbi:MAG: AAA family ATPase [Blastocatellia bacterium]|nr:AAA family ATPase [Blastocatellia bacterium]